MKFTQEQLQKLYNGWGTIFIHKSKYYQIHYNNNAGFSYTEIRNPNLNNFVGELRQAGTYHSAIIGWQTVGLSSTEGVGEELEQPPLWNKLTLRRRNMNKLALDIAERLAGMGVSL